MSASSRLTQASVALGIAGALTVGATLLPVDLGRTVDPSPVGAQAESGEAAFTPTGSTVQQIEQLKAHLDSQPADSRSWAVLALLLIEQGRSTADPTVYAQAEQAGATSLEITPRGNDLALAANAALLSAQHRFDRALRQADRALRVNPYSVPALGVRVDALTELGRLDRAARAASQFDTAQPGLAATTRLAYQAELRGHDRQARSLFTRSGSETTAPAAIAFVEFHLAEIARRAGQLKVASQHYSAALDAVPSDPAALAGRARILALRGELERATTILEDVVATTPSIEHLVALGELYELQGDREAADQQYDVVRAAGALALSSGVRPDLELSWFEADHGDSAEALRLARAEWDRRHSPLTADALAWALHVNDRDQAALRYARLATAYGGDARSWHHRGAIEAALGMKDQARQHLRRALEVDRGYSPWAAAELRRTLSELGGQS